MVSNANDDFPLPDTPVNTISLFFGNCKSIFFKLCCLAPLITIFDSILSSLKKTQAAPPNLHGLRKDGYDPCYYYNPKKKKMSRDWAKKITMGYNSANIAM